MIFIPPFYFTLVIFAISEDFARELEGLARFGSEKCLTSVHLLLVVNGNSSIMEPSVWNLDLMVVPARKVIPHHLDEV